VHQLHYVGKHVGKLVIAITHGKSDIYRWRPISGSKHVGKLVGKHVGEHQFGSQSYTLFSTQFGT
jgi:hypothetical protein